MSFGRSFIAPVGAIDGIMYTQYFSVGCGVAIGSET